MDARSIAATAANGGILTSAADIDYTIPNLKYKYDGDIYKKRCYYGFGKPQPEEELRMGPNITDWPKFDPLQKNLLVRLAAVIRDPVTTTDELIPSARPLLPQQPAETFGIRPLPPGAGICRPLEGGAAEAAEVKTGKHPEDLVRVMGSLGLPNRPSTSAQSARLSSPAAGRRLRPEQAASCQRVLGGGGEHRLQLRHQTLPLQLHQLGHPPLYGRPAGDLPPLTRTTPSLSRTSARRSKTGAQTVTGHMVRTDGTVAPITLHLPDMTADERQIILEGCLMNYYAAGYGKD